MQMRVEVICGKQTFASKPLGVVVGSRPGFGGNDRSDTRLADEGRALSEWFLTTVEV